MTTNQTYYAVVGASAVDMYESMAEQRPHRNDGVAVATTEWRARLEWRPVEELYGCRPEAIWVRLEFTITLPRWDPPMEASGQLVTLWNKFLLAVRAHEDRHQRITIGEAGKLADGLEDLRASTCSRLQQRVVFARQEFQRTAQQLNLEYDQATANGGSEGVRWPPQRD